jgi:uncharacterized protein YceH (UPF0502 family)
VEPLSQNACRALGSLLEKQRTVPATYPLTPAALLAACNQTTGRDPVLALDEATLDAAIDELRAAGAVRLVHPSHGARTVKYRQVADELLGLDAPAHAVLALLLLRGPQTAGELRTRSDRLHEFASVDELDTTLARLADHEPPLVARLERRPGQKEPRWTHRLAAPTSDPTPEPAPEPSADLPPALPPELWRLSGFVGGWRGGGDGVYPTISPFGYTEQIELRPVPGKPLLSYRSSTRATDDGRALHSESGFLRAVGDPADGRVELVVAQGAGIVEIAEGLVGAGEIVLESTVVWGTTTAKEVTATERRYRVAGDALTYELSMAVVGQPLLPHLRAELRRSS